MTTTPSSLTMPSDSHPSASPFVPPSLQAPRHHIRELQDVLASGGIATFDARSALRSRRASKTSIFDWSLSEWDRHFGHCIVRSQALVPELQDAIIHYFDSCPNDVFLPEPKELKELRARLMKTGVGRIFSNEPLPLGKFLQQLYPHAGVRPEPAWTKDYTSVAEERRRLTLSKAYAVANTKRFPGLDEYEYSEVFRPWKMMFNFLWLGMSTGGLHIDNLDNTIIQLCGTKKVLVYSPDLLDAISGGHHQLDFEATRFLSPSNLQVHKYLKWLPHYVVDLKPGDGLILPAAAYHAVFATSYDSISINSFLLPHFRTGPFPYHRLMRPVYDAGLREGWVLHPGIAALWAKAGLSRLVHTMTGYVWQKHGPYELV